jgi:hypothetical protein
MRKIGLLVGASFGIATLALTAELAAAEHITVVPQPGVVVAQPGVVYTQPAPAPRSVTVVPAPTVVTPAPATVTVVPAPSTVVVPSPSPSSSTPIQQTMYAEQIRAGVVRANTIYANRIEADRVQGVIHHTGSVKVNAPSGEIVGSDVATSVIYADAIAANSVLADNIYVRDLEMSPAKFVIVPLQGGTIVRRQSP